MNFMAKKGFYRVYSSISVNSDGSPVALFDFDAEIFVRCERKNNQGRSIISFEDSGDSETFIKHDFDALSVSVRFIGEE